jgi:CRP-like cAMP-binding protein
MNEDLKSLLREECNFKPSDEVLDMFLDSMTEECVKPASRIIDYGRVNSDVYCLKKGIVRLFHVEDSKEKTFGFALPGTVFLSPLSFYLNAPAFIMAETCKCPVTLLRMDRQTFNSLVDRSGEFARWMLSLATAQICICERKLSIINGSAMERYKAVLENRPEILESVTNRVLASYLDITPQHLCRLKKQIVY